MYTYLRNIALIIHSGAFYYIRYVFRDWGVTKLLDEWGNVATYALCYLLYSSCIYDLGFLNAVLTMSQSIQNFVINLRPRNIYLSGQQRCKPSKHA